MGKLSSSILIGVRKSFQPIMSSYSWLPHCRTFSWKKEGKERDWGVVTSQWSYILMPLNLDSFHQMAILHIGCQKDNVKTGESSQIGGEHSRAATIAIVIIKLNRLHSINKPSNNYSIGLVTISSPSRYFDNWVLDWGYFVINNNRWFWLKRTISKL